MSKLEAVYNDVKQFHHAFDVKMYDAPTALNVHELNQRYNLLKDELDEFLFTPEIEEQVDALIDTIYIAIGTLTIMGVEPSNIWDIVHKANMSKLHDGKVVKNQHGKVVKPSGWIAPEAEIAREIERQKETANL